MRQRPPEQSPYALQMEQHPVCFMESVIGWIFRPEHVPPAGAYHGVITGLAPGRKRRARC